MLHFKLDPWPVITFMTKAFCGVHKEEKQRVLGGSYQPCQIDNSEGHQEVMQTEQNTEKLKA